MDLSEFEERLLRSDNPLFIEVWRRTRNRNAFGEELKEVR